MGTRLSWSPLYCAESSKDHGVFQIRAQIYKKVSYILVMIRLVTGSRDCVRASQYRGHNTTSRARNNNRPQRVNSKEQLAHKMLTPLVRTSLYLCLLR